MSTTSFSLESISADRSVSQYDFSTNFSPNIVAGKDGNVFLTYTNNDTNNVDRVFLAPDCTLLGERGPATVNKAGNQFVPHSAVLKDGNLVTVYDDQTGSGPRIQLAGPGGAFLKADFPLPHDEHIAFQPEVAALSDGGFVVTWTKAFPNNDFDIRTQVYDADGTPRGDTLITEISSKISTLDPVVTGLAHGGFVVTWSEHTLGVGSDRIVSQLYSAKGAAVGDPVTIDDVGTVNDHPATVALADGGYAVAYTDNGWSGADNDITLKIFNQDGTPRTGFIRVNADSLGATDGGNTTGNQLEPSLTVLSNGAVAVSWTTTQGVPFFEDAEINARVFDPKTGVALTGITNVGHTENGDIGSSLAGLKNGALGVAYVSDALGQPATIHYHEVGLVRTTTGDASSETLTGNSDIDKLIGLGGNDKLFGLDGNDTLDGGSGNDALDGGAGNDAMSGGAGNDTYAVDSIGDKVIEAAGQGTDTVVASSSFTLSSNVENLTLTGTGNIFGVGNDIANVLVGNGNNNVLNGEAGADTMKGGLGDDIYAVDNAGDKIIEVAGQGIDTVQAQSSYTLAANVEKLIQVGTANIAGTGNELANTIQGNLGANIFTGGAGNDTFVFKTQFGSSNLDHITDFSAPADTMQLGHFVFQGLTVGELDAALFKDLGVAGAKVDADDRILYDHRTGALSFDADGSGAGKAVQFATLDNHALITAHDFFIV